MNAVGLQPLAVLGGTFDPIHFGHLRTALEVIELLQCEDIRLIPCRISLHREPPLATAQQRADMVALAVQNHNAFRLDTRELERSGPSYSFDTLVSLRAEIGDQRSLYLIVGMDAFVGFPSWYRWRDILSMAHVVVMHRPGYSAVKDLDVELVVAQTDSVADTWHQAAGRILFYPVTQLDISSTEIRQCIRAGQSPEYLLPKEVCTYIRQHRLYRCVATELQ